MNIKPKIKSFNRQKDNQGLILVDILLAMSLAVLFVVLISESSAASRDIFEFAKERNRLLSIYEEHASEFEGMMPYEFRSLIIGADNWEYSTTTINADAHWYGNDRIQTDITISSNSDTPAELNIRNRLYSQSVTFNKVKAYPVTSINDFAGTSLCSVDFTNKNTVGSYGYNNSKTNPQLLVPQITPIVLLIDPSIPLTDLEAINDHMYISTDSSRASDPDIIMADISDPSHLILDAELNTGPGIASIVVAGNRIYAAMTSRTAQLQIISIPFIGSMNVESSYKLPLPYATATPPLGGAIFYEKNRVYLGTEKWDGEEFTIIDVTNPGAPLKIGGYETGSKIGSIYVRNGIAYVTASDEKQLRVIDVHDPTNLILFDSYSPSGWERQEGKALSFFEDSLGWGRTSGGFNIKTDHELFSWGTSTITSYQKQNHLPLSNPEELRSSDVPGGIYGIVPDRSFVYVATKQFGKELQIYDKSLSTTTMKSISLPATPQTMVCDGDSLYILAATAPVIYKVTFK